MLKGVKKTAWIFIFRFFQEKRKYAWFHEFSRTIRSTKTEKLS